MPRSVRLLRIASLIAVLPLAALGQTSTPFTHAGLTLTLPGTWTIHSELPSGVVLAGPGPEPIAMLMVMNPAPREGELSLDLNRMATKEAGARPLLEADPIPPRVVRAEGPEGTAVTWAYQRRVYEENPRPLELHWYGFDGGRTLHALALVGTANNPALTALNERMGESFRTARLSPASTADAAPPPSPPRGSSSREWPAMPKGTGSGGTVPFKLQSVRHVPSAGPAYHLLLAQNPDGRLFLSHNGRDSVVLPPEASGVFEWTGDGRVLVMGQGDANDHLGMNSRRVTDVWTDRSGTLFGAFDGSYGRVPMQGVLARLPDETLVKVADVAAMRALGDGTEWGIDSAFSVAPNGDVWMFVKQGLGAPRIGLMERVGEGAWRLREVHPFPQGEVPPPQVLGFGTADPFGGYVFFHDGDLWRFTPDAPARLLAKVDLPLDEGTRITGPVVTPDGHVWLALSPSREVMQWTEAHSPTHRKLMTSVVAGGSSGLVRITPDGQGGSKVAVIPAAALRKELGRVHGETPAKVRIVKLQPDHATGGLAGYDSDGRLHFRLVPER